MQTVQAIRRTVVGMGCSRGMAASIDSTAPCHIARDVSAGLVSGNRFMLSKAITFAESTRADHRRLGAEILDRALRARADNATTDAAQTLRVGISGPPGVGKSTFIEALGMHLIDHHGVRVAVVAIDPTSDKSKGAILGDKTRMQQLSAMPGAFVRPCAAGFRHLGGVALHSDEVVLLCEAAGYDVILVETVGVGQSETLVKEMADMCLLLLPPAGGDELQGIKRGIVETADAIVVNKADGDMEMAARRAMSEYRAALQVLRSSSTSSAKSDDARDAGGQEGGVWGRGDEGQWQVRVALASAATGAGVAQICDMLFEFAALKRRSGDLTRRRAQQRAEWMWRKAEDDVVKRLRSDGSVRREAARLLGELGCGRTSSRAAGAALVECFVAALSSDRHA